MTVLSLRPTHVLRGMAKRATAIASEYGSDATRYNRLACDCLAEIERRIAADRQTLSDLSVPVDYSLTGVG